MVVTHFAPAPITQLIFVLEVTNLYTNYPFFPYKCQPFKALQEYHRPCVLMLNTWCSFVITYSTIRVGCNTCWGEVSVDTRECASKKWCIGIKEQFLSLFLCDWPYLKHTLACAAVYISLVEQTFIIQRTLSKVSTMQVCVVECGLSIREEEATAQQRHIITPALCLFNFS